jgi:hypothetical protein
MKVRGQGQSQVGSNKPPDLDVDEHSKLYSISLRDELPAAKYHLDQLNIGKKENSLAMLLGEPLMLNDEDVRRFFRLGHVISFMLHQTERIYALSLLRPHMFWLRGLFEGKLSDRAKDLSRQSILLNRLFPPVAYRPDFINDEKIAEIQVQGSTLGIHHALHQRFRGRDPMSPSVLSRIYATAIREYTGKDHPSVLFLAHAYGSRETAFFSKVLTRTHGIHADVLVIDKDCEPIGPHAYDLIFWKGCLDKLLQNKALTWVFTEFEGSERLHQIFVPALSCLRLSKMNLMLPFLSKTKHLFTNDIRDLLPHTRLITDEVAESLSKLSISKRRKLVVKYAGQDFSMNWGSKGVYMLGRSSKQDREILERATKDPMSSPWIVQDRIRSKFEIYFISPSSAIEHAKGLSARINPRYIQMFDGSLKFAGAIVLFSKSWKCHGAEENIIAPMLYVSDPSFRISCGSRHLKDARRQTSPTSH